jgi:hypothetical protein
MSWVNDKSRYEQLAKSVDSSVVLVTKDYWFWKALAWLLLIISFGQFKREKFLTRFATTIGPIQAYPSEWSTLSEGIIVHESHHTKQARWFGFLIHPWVGLLPMALFYLFLPLPILLAYFRYRLELGADKARWEHTLAQAQTQWEYHRQVSNIKSHAERRAKTLSGWSYIVSWPRPLALWGYRRASKKVIAKFLQKQKRS